MNQGKKYKTRQGEVILDEIRRSGSSYVTIQQIRQALDVSGETVGLTTIYRQLDKLEKAGCIAKVKIDGVNAACYRYVKNEQKECFSIKCEKCGKIVSMECDHISELYSHIEESHDFTIDRRKTVFYGICDKCRS